MSSIDKLLPFALAALALGAVARSQNAGPAADEMFGHQVRPILQEYCVRCHGGEKTKAGLDLSTFTGALRGGETGAAIVPGKSAESFLWEQIATKEMPPEDEMPLPEAKARIIATWIDTAKFPATLPPPAAAAGSAAVHERAKTLWSFHPPVRPALPEIKNAARVRTPVDRFILAKLEAEENASLSPDAEPRSRLRRVYFNLTGLPPTPREIGEFLADRRPDAWEHLVDRLLASPRYGERWGRHWLDVAGWAESSLLVGDNVRPGYWRYRDWVIRAFNADLPYDQFVREQLAGDELTTWRDQDRFDPATIDRLTATGFLRCPPDGTDNQPITQEEKRFATQQTAVEVSTKALLGLTFNCVRCHDHKYDPVTQKEYYQLTAIFEPAYDLGKWLPGTVNAFGAGPVRVIPIADRKGREAFRARLDGLGRESAELSYQKENGIPNKYRDRYISEHLDEVPPEIDRTLLGEALKLEERQRTDPQKQVVYAAAKVFNLGAERIKELFPRISAEQKENQQQQKALAAKGSDLGEVIWALWDVSTEPSPTRVLKRGEFRTPGDPVEPGVPRMLDRADDPWTAPVIPPGQPTTGRRLAYANWLVRPDHPLTARVMVNRIWQYHFGTGIVATTDDFGVRGAKPSHPELLDWLATEFIASGWSVKHLHRLIVNSSTYRQASAPLIPASAPATAATALDAREIDHALLASFPRRRLEAEAIRDTMLVVSGLLDETMFGESVPTDELEDGSYDIPKKHPGRYRRTVYVSTRRAWIPTFLALFDQPSMDTNWPKRNDSAIAPQALAMTNHAFALECADGLAGRILDARGDTSQRLDLAFTLAYGRHPSVEELAIFAPVADAPAASSSPEKTRAAWRTIAHALLASSEFLYLD